MSEERFQQWCILELMGHRRLAGLVTETEVGGATFLKLDVPGENQPCPVCTDTVKTLLVIDGQEHEVCPQCGGSRTVPHWEASQYYSPSAVYCITPTTEEIARQVASRNRPEPVHRWEFKAIEAPRREPEHYGDEDEGF